MDPEKPSIDDVSAGDVIEYKTFPVSMEQGGDIPEGHFRIRAAVFNSVDSVGDVITPGAFKNAIPEFLNKGFISFNHEWYTKKSLPIGKPTKAYEDAQGLVVEGKISDTAQGRDVLTLMRDGVLTGASIGYKASAKRDLTPAEGKAMLGEVEYKSAMEKLPRGRRAIRHLIEISPLIEAGPVVGPAHAEAQILGVKSDEPLPVEGQTLSDQFKGAHAASDEALERWKELTERVDDLGELRFKEGRTHSKATIEKMKASATALEEHAAMFREMIAAAEKESPENKAAEVEAETKAALLLDARREQARFLRHEAERRGVFA